MQLKRQLGSDEGFQESIGDAEAFFSTEASCMWGQKKTILAIKDGAAPKGKKGTAASKAKARASAGKASGSRDIDTFPEEKKASPDAKLTSVINKTGNLITKLTAAQIQVGKDPMAKALVSSIKAKVEELSKVNRNNMKASKGNSTSASEVNKIVVAFNKHTQSASELLAKAKPFSKK
eukprot:7880895-Pyramimonas_sp.AAC.1